MPARANPELAVLSAMAHGKGSDVERYEREFARLLAVRFGPLTD
jgi:hypothetical protein